MQYCCPGCASWNELLPLYSVAYNNILRQCNYARRYGAIGVLNTDWGDYLHVGHPDLSRVGMIYGAAFSWNPEIPSYEEINRQISRLELRCADGELLAVVARMEDCAVFDWGLTCLYKEWKEGVPEVEEDCKARLAQAMRRLPEIGEQNARLEAAERELYGKLSLMDSSARPLLTPYLLAAEGMRLFNKVGQVVLADDGQTDGQTAEHSRAAAGQTAIDKKTLAAGLELWLYHYKQAYRSVSRESELRRIEALVSWYGDYLRDNAAD